MQTGERITLIKRIAAGLAEQDWADIDLILGQFGFPWSDIDHDSGAYEYAVSRLQNGEDSALVQVHEYLYPDASGIPQPEHGGPWTPDTFRLFMSHTNEHKKVAADIRSVMSRWGIDCFVAHQMIEPTKEWQDEIESALYTCDALAALLTPDFSQSKWCDQEVGFAVARSVLIIPIRAGVDPYGFIAKYQALTPAGPLEYGRYDLAGSIFDLLVASEQTNEKMTQPIVQRYVNSGSFDNTRAAFAHLEAIPKERWTQDMADAIEAAATSNTQVEHAVKLGVGRGEGEPMPDAARALIGERLGSADDDIPF
jgi:TIR domain